MSKLSPKKPVIEFQVELEENKGSNVSTAIDPNTDVSYTINCSFVIKVSYRYPVQMHLEPHKV